MSETRRKINDDKLRLMSVGLELRVVHSFDNQLSGDGRDFEDGDCGGSWLA